ncbi:MAG: type II toxin-antitoxin system VapC family toxin [Candidatus Latescibacteria bacterium]|nr:type II toxin-antitoxin system VapC family toxin [Candidatus Latescibacterota bacterium]
MEKPTLYLETTIPSYYTARVSQNLIVAAHQAITIEWWQNESHKYAMYISQFVLDEVAEGDPEASQRRLDFLSPFPLLETTDEVLSLTKAILRARFSPEKAIRDASHIAIVAVHGVEYLLTWNCTHINNATLKEKLRIVCEQQGVHFPIICTPEELMEEDYDP